ncbi:hypothetical protein AM588_10000876 [Phytophthora nicotianae]|uniref:ZSWIM1/3 RNaseH-like domain-containing protein n=1 Tax=Phytophthora nicotianae TaxID=4792 RepID=A0A0W8CMQ3_PHYNI|nr:hypothetical protein AM588_10000876 [Phytophthora nicotianae]
MKRLFRAFPEVVLVDTTHGTNQNRYKLFSFVVHDVFGKGQYVQHALILNETKPLLRCAVDSFKRSSPEWQNVKVVISDKAFHEKDVMLEAFTGARQLLCLFHVQKWLHEQVGTRVVASIAVKNEVKSSLSALIYSKSEEDYLTQRSALLHHLGGSSKNGRRHLNVAFTARVAEEEYIGEINRVGSRPQIEGEDHELADLALHVSNHAFDYVKAEYSYAAVGGSAHYSVNITESEQAQLKPVLN